MSGIGGGKEVVEESEIGDRRLRLWRESGRRERRRRQSLPPLSPCHFQVDYMDENEEYFQRQASHRQSRRRFRKINQKGERQTIIDTVDPYPTGKPPIARGYHTVSCSPRYTLVFTLAVADRCVRRRWLGVALCLCCVCRVPYSKPVVHPRFRTELYCCSLSHKFHVLSPFGGLRWSWVLWAAVSWCLMSWGRVRSEPVFLILLLVVVLNCCFTLLC